MNLGTTWSSFFLFFFNFSFFFCVQNLWYKQVRGESHISLDFLLPKSGYGNIDMTAQTESIPRNYAPAFASKNYTEKVTFSTTRSDPVGVEPDVRDSIMRSYSEYWNQLTRIALPYLPFIRFVF